MNRTEHLLVCVAEECAEISQAVDKALRFGLDDGNPEGITTNAEDIVKEYTDLIAVMKMLFEEGQLRDNISDTQIEEKRIKVNRYIQYARAKGILRD